MNPNEVAPIVLQADPADWIVVEDFSGTWDGFGYRDSLDVTALWSPSLKSTRFTGMWGETPDMPSAEMPDEERLWAWVKSSDTNFSRRYNAAKRRSDAYRLRQEAVQRHYETQGYNWITVQFSAPDGSSRTISHCCGILDRMQMLRAATSYMQEEMSPGSKLVRFRLEAGLSEIEVERRRKAARNITEAGSDERKAA